MHRQLAPANYASKTRHISRTSGNYSFPSALNQRSVYSDVRPPSATFESDRLRITNGMMNECFGS